ncbi:MAG: methylmalonyl-CoA epimerase [Gammaproteobacteria bacterium]|nr:methylmalonyl-CoA epimerase [Gammaproteobacteria bacterium]
MTLGTYPLFQQAYLVNDIEASAKHWSRVFGAGPFFLAPHHQTDRFVYRGTAQQADVSYAFGYLGDTMIQFIQQHDDTPSIYRDMFKAGEEGFHHVGVLVHDWDAERQRLLDMGFDIACELWADNVNAAYFDTRKVNGCFTEIHGDPPHIIETFARWRRAHARFRPGDHPISQPQSG